MPNKRLPMREVREVLRLKNECGLANRAIARSCKLSRSTVADYLRRAQRAGLGWPLPEDISEAQIQQRLFPPLLDAAGPDRPLPDFQYIYDELRNHKNVNLTRTQLWLEYKERFPEGYQYTQFTQHYRQWLKKMDYCMRQEHRPGENLFLDYAKGLFITNPTTGEQISTELFVAVWGASNYTYAEASLSQALPCWIKSNVRAFEFFGCVPRMLVPDCLKSAVSKACRYEPEINQTYQDMATHYGCAVVPARPYHPRDKAKVEVGVLIAKRWILSVLRHRTFFSLVELNNAIEKLLENLNNRLLRKIKQSRKQLFDTTDKVHAIGLPGSAYEFAEWKKVTVNIDYHIQVDHHYYSVPFHLLRESLDVRLTDKTLEVFQKGQRIACHPRSYVHHKHTTQKEHMPLAHQQHLDWTPTRISAWARKIGKSTACLVEKILASRTHPEQGYRSCLGILRLATAKNYGDARVEAAAKRAIQYNTCSYKSVRSILKEGLDRQSDALSERATAPPLPMHENIRGENYYN